MAGVSFRCMADKSVLRARKAMNGAIRRYFDDLGFLEVETPIAVTSPGLEPHLFAFETVAVGPDRSREVLYLHTSPEYAMKKMLGRGFGHIYQLARVFRNGERSRTHAREFTMLEWYRCPGRIGEIMDDVEELIGGVASVLKGSWRPRRFERVSVSEAFARVGLADPLEFADPSSLRTAIGFGREGDSWDDVFFRAFLERVEPSFAADTITILYGYPAHMAALARIDPADPRRAERFEVYAGAIELGNAFGELTDPVEQRARFEADLHVREANGAPLYPIDEELLAALPAIGSAAGIALGVDRLLMLCLGIDSIDEVI
jgi:elongation factor P--(R)-beta-lysine ligase